MKLAKHLGRCSCGHKSHKGGVCGRKIMPGTDWDETEFGALICEKCLKKHTKRIRG